MSRRTRKPDLEFGSDSFLDIIANVVGILIILIVVAGVQVSQAPIDIPDEAVADAVPVVAPVVEVEPEPEPAEPAKPARVAPVIQLPPAKPPTELVHRADQLQVEIAQLTAEQQANQNALAGLKQLEQTAYAKLQSAVEAVESEQTQLATVNARLQRMQSLLGETRTTVDTLQAELALAENEQAPVKTLEHRVTPISEVVSGKELHFRLLGNQVAHVPIDELIERLRSQIDRQKEWLTKFNRHQGHVGPIEGFSMTYVVERQPLSVIEELRHGRGVMRIGVSRWKIVPDASLKAETAAEALSPGSAFVQALLSSGSDTTLTFWVYPDSFELYRRLQRVAQNEGFRVAARPMPFNVPIAGSPSGTRSAGQ